MILTLVTLKKIFKITEEIEGFSAFPKKDTNGKEVIGIGHNFINPLSHYAAHILLEEDIYQTIGELSTAYPWLENLSEDRIIVLVYMHFNLGAKKFSEFYKMLTAAKNGQWIECANEIRNSLAAHQSSNAYEKLAHWMEIGIIE